MVMSSWAWAKEETIALKHMQEVRTKKKKNKKKKRTDT
jgi:hypothetical protein